MAKPVWPEGNLILSAVPPEEHDRLLPHVECIALGSRRELYASGAHLGELYFPVDCVVATFGVSREGATATYALIGRESFVGLNALLGDTRAVGNAVVQVPGHAWRIPVAPLAEAFRRSEQLRRAVLRCASSRVLQTSQTALCNAHHHVEQRLCSWILQTLDRVGGAEVRVTHELIGTVLGVRREAVTIAAMRVQSRGAIACGRARIAVLDRRLLQSLSCECYGLLRADVEVMMRDISGSWNGSQAR
jgi:CRP-like cAMP-binding protein